MVASFFVGAGIIFAVGLGLYIFAVLEGRRKRPTEDKAKIKFLGFSLEVIGHAGLIIMILAATAFLIIIGLIVLREFDIL